MAVTELTDAEKRQIRDYIPSLSNRAPGFDLASKLDAVVSALNDAAVASNVVSGTDTVANGADAVTVALDASHDGRHIAWA